LFLNCTPFSTILKYLTILTIFTMAATKRIPVSEETWKELGEEKESGQTWDELLEEMKIELEKHRLAKNAREMKEGEVDTVDLDDV
jgi:hypothetical protein